MWVARDEDFSLWIHFDRPIKKKNTELKDGYWSSLGGRVEVPPTFFPEVKWEDEVPKELVLK